MFASSVPVPVGIDAPHLHTVHLRLKSRGKASEKDVEVATPSQPTKGR